MQEFGSECKFPEAFQCLKMNLTFGKSSNFWIIARAVAEFVTNPQQGNGLLPLSGGVPDMKAESKEYVKLQTL